MNLAIDGFKSPYTIFDHDTRRHLDGEYTTWDEAKAGMDAIRGFERNLCVDGHETPHVYGNEPNWAGDGQLGQIELLDEHRLAVERRLARDPVAGEA